jgi:acetoin utilization deacetylase AcuC-like enzyme
MRRLRIFYSDRYTVELPPGHRFPMQKYRMVREGLVAAGLVSPSELFEPDLADRATLERAHTPEYVAALCDGTIDPRAMRRIGFPWSPALVTRSLASVGGALAAAEEALRTGVSGNLAGGTHHAQAAWGEGYCVFNDLAVTALHLLATHSISRIAIVDLDVHQGNGCAAILGNHPGVFVFSMHGDKNFPFRKVASTLDVALPDATGDEDYLTALSGSLPQVLDFAPELILYQAGVDPLEEDALGRLSLTMEGLAERDRVVLSACRKHDIPVSLALGGGYAEPIERTVDAHVQTYRVLREVF